MSDAEVQAVERLLEARLADQLRYDLKVSLVALAGGGYNIVAHNRRNRRDVRGLCDPSFVAFNIANYTAATNWRSTNLHVWLVPYADGWAVPTSGSRMAVQRGMESSALGSLGVVEVKAFRSWLEQTFKPLDAAAVLVEPDDLESGFRLPLFPHVDAGATARDAGPKPTRAVRPAPIGETELRAAWALYERGDLAGARRSLMRAKKAGFDDPDLATLLAE